jgi:hypothetical protein
MPEHYKVTATLKDGATRVTLVAGRTWGEARRLAREFGHIVGAVRVTVEG